VAALTAAHLRLPFHQVEGAAASRNKALARERFRAAGLPVPRFRKLSLSTDPAAVTGLWFPCVIKPLGLSASRGVIRADDQAAFGAAFSRVRALLERLPSEDRRDGALESDAVVVEEFIPGREFALEGVMTAGTLQVLAVFDKPDPLEGPFFEETIYITPSAAPARDQAALASAVGTAARATGLVQGPIHAECRVNERGVFVLEVAARPIGGLCARALRFVPDDTTLESLLLRHALGEPTDRFTREPDASGVMMIPIPARGLFRRVAGVEEARRVAHVIDVQITAKPDQLLIPLPEGSTYLGFIFARAPRADQVEHALRQAHARLEFTIEPELRMVQSRHG
jgi:biotin carboxylase